jgi:hypothetical protein
MHKRQTAPLDPDSAQAAAHDQRAGHELASIVVTIEDEPTAAQLGHIDRALGNEAGLLARCAAQPAM